MLAVILLPAIDNLSSEKRMDHFSLIEAYLAGELNEQETAAVEQRIQTDPAFAAEVHLLRDTQSVLSLHQQQAYKAQLQALDAAEQAPVRRLTPRWLAVAAAVVLLALVGLWSLNRPSDGPYAGAFAPYPNRLTLRGDASSDQLDEAMRAYNNADYAAAAQQLAELVSSDTAREDLRFYLGVARLGAGQPATAARVLASVRAPSLYTQQAEWYRALAMGQADKTEQARLLLQRVARSETHPYQSQAQTLLRQLPTEP